MLDELVSTALFENNHRRPKRSRVGLLYNKEKSNNGTEEIELMPPNAKTTTQKFTVDDQHTHELNGKDSNCDEPHVGSHKHPNQIESYSINISSKNHVFESLKSSTSQEESFCNYLVENDTEKSTKKNSLSSSIRQTCEVPSEESNETIDFPYASQSQDIECYHILEDVIHDKETECITHVLNEEVSSSSSTYQTSEVPKISQDSTNLSCASKNREIECNESHEDTINDRDIEEVKILLPEMYKWTHFRYLSQIEQEILWLTELSSFFHCQQQRENMNKDLTEDSNGSREKLMFAFVHEKMSPELKKAIEDNFGKSINNDGQIDTNSKLIRMGIRLMNPNVKCEFIVKRREARMKLEKMVQSKHKKKRNRVNERWAQCHEKESNNLDFKLGEQVFLFEKSNNSSLPKRLYYGEVLGRIPASGDRHEIDTIPVSCELYSMMLDNSSIEHGIVTQSIFNQRDIEKMKELIHQKEES